LHSTESALRLKKSLKNWFRPLGVNIADKISSTRQTLGTKTSKRCCHVGVLKAVIHWLLTFSVKAQWTKFCLPPIKLMEFFIILIGAVVWSAPQTQSPKTRDLDSCSKVVVSIPTSYLFMCPMKTHDAHSILHIHAYVWNCFQGWNQWKCMTWLIMHGHYSQNENRSSLQIKITVCND
jgi:hypothetical protein